MRSHCVTATSLCRQLLSAAGLVAPVDIDFLFFLIHNFLNTLDVPARGSRLKRMRSHQRVAVVDMNSYGKASLVSWW